jgi:hypothetical protein
VPGLYYLTSTLIYGLGSSTATWGQPAQQAMLISGGSGTFVLQVVRAQPAYGCERGNLSIASSSNTLAATETCGDIFDSAGDGGAEDGGSQAVLYTATSTTIVITIPQDGGAVTEVDSYTLQ